MEKVKPTCFKTREVLEQVEVLGYIKLKTFYLLKKNIYTFFFFSFSFALLHCVAVIVTVTSQQEGSKSAAQY